MVNKHNIIYLYTEYDFDAKQLKIDLSNSLSNIEYYNFDGISAKIGNKKNGLTYYVNAYDVLAQIMGYNIYKCYIFNDDISIHFPEFDDMLNQNIIVGTTENLQHSKRIS